MKKFEVFQELPKCDTEILSEQMLFINGNLKFEMYCTVLLSIFNLI